MNEKDYVTRQQMKEYSDYIQDQIYNKDTVEDKLDKIPFEKIERYVRKKKLERISEK